MSTANQKMVTPASAGDFWARPTEALLRDLQSGSQGLGGSEAKARLARFGRNSIKSHAAAGIGRLLVKQFENPLVLILLVGAAISLFVREWIDAAIILAIVTGSALLGFIQEFRASRAVEQLRSRLALRAKVVRDGQEVAVPVETIVPGDIVVLSAGNLVPADGVIVEAHDLVTSEAALTGESFPVEKRPGVVARDTPLAARANCLFLGTSVRSGTARMLAIATGRATNFGMVAGRLDGVSLETEFARGLRGFGELLMRVMLVIVTAVMAVNLLLHRPFIDSLLFGMALAVGLSPELLPAIVSVTLAAGARTMAQHGVIVRQLEAIENLGSIDVLCTDKTGTLTEGVISLGAALGPEGAPSAALLRLAFINASLQSGLDSPLDAAILAAAKAAGLRCAASKIGEIPYDFERRRLTLIADDGALIAVTKGAFTEVLSCCTRVRRDDAEVRLDADQRRRLETFFASKGNAGFRVLGVATRVVERQSDYDATIETDMVFAGFLLFFDPPKAGIDQSLRALRDLGVEVKIISGDNRFVSAHIAQIIGLDGGALLTGRDIAALDDAALGARATATSVFAEIDPQQKERIVRVLQRSGHAVGYLGDGINDAPALQASDVGISVDHAVDVARESADIVLLRRDLDVLRRGVEDGRRTFANTLKYINITTSANFGNMISMALATLYLPFLPLLPKQILLNNFLSGLPLVTIANDSVDPEYIRSARRWDIAEIRRFMLVFGLLSTIFDLLTFVLLLEIAHAGEPLFQTVWFLVSLLTELVVVFVLRTRRPWLRSAPGVLLLWTSVAMAIVALCLPFAGPIAQMFGFVPLSIAMLATSLVIVLVYAFSTELVKRRLFPPHASSG